MLRFSRSDHSPAAKKAPIVDGPAAKAWLAAMSQPGSLASLADMTQVLHALGPSGVEDGVGALLPQRRFAIAERIRGVLLPILQERGNDERLAFLPVDEDLARHCWAAIDAAAALRDAYAWLVSQLAEAPVEVDSSISGSTIAGGLQSTSITGVGALHRALDVDAQLMLCIQRARWAVPTAVWERHCVLGQLVRDLDCQDVEVPDVLRASLTRTCRAAFVTPVLVALADPAARSTPEFHVVRMAAQRWAGKVGFRLERRVDGGVAPARPIANPGPSVQLSNFMLRLDTQSAMQSIDLRLDALAEGKTPREVGIGDTLRPQAARELLVQLRLRWGAVSPAEIDSPDRAWRPHGGGLQVMAVVGMPHADTRRAGGDATARGAPNPYAYQRERHGGITRSRDEIVLERVTRLMSGAETWTLAAESGDAVRCIRRYPRPHIGLQRLIGLQLGTAGADAPFLLGWVEALQGSGVRDAEGRMLQSGAQQVRVRLAPGIPQLLQASIDDAELDWAFLLVPGVGAAAGRNGRAAPFVPMLSDAGPNACLSLTGDDEGWTAVRTSPRDHALVLPHATFRPQRLVRAGRAGMPATLRLEELVMRGSDFDLVRFTPL